MTSLLMCSYGQIRQSDFTRWFEMCFTCGICFILINAMRSEVGHASSSVYGFSTPLTTTDDLVRKFQQCLERNFCADRLSNFVVLNSMAVDTGDDSSGQVFSHQGRRLEPRILECFRLETGSGVRASYFLNARVGRPPSGEKFLLLRESVARDEYGLSVSRLESAPGLGRDGSIPESLLTLVSGEKTPALQYWKKSDDQYSSLFGVASVSAVFAGFLPCSGEVIDFRSEEFVTDWTISEEIEGQTTLSHKRRPAKLTFVAEQLSRIEFQDGDVVVELASFQFDSNEVVVAFDAGLVDGAKKNLVQLIAVTPAIDEPWFEVFRVLDGTPVYDQTERNLYREIREQAAVFVVDEDAKNAISSALETTGGTIKSRSESESREVQLGSHLSGPATNRLCGLYSISFAAAALGFDVPVEKLVTSSNYLSHTEGSSAGDLMRVAEDHGLNSWFVSNASLKMLRQHNGPSLLRIRDPSGTAGHWVVLSRFDDKGRAVIVDLPEREVLLEETDLLTYWDSQAILLSNTVIDSRSIVMGRFEQLFPAFLVIVLLVAIRVMCSSVTRRAWQIQIIALVGIGFGLAVVWQLASPTSYLNNPGPVRFVTASSPGAVKIIYQLPESLDSIQLIDCRMSPDYNSGTIGNAINLPINTRFAAFRRITESLSTETPIVVFCQSTQCIWSDSVAAKLYASGFRDVSVYRPGFVGIAPRDEEN
jgi:rhodanese-related sulfurtransferase